MARESDAIEVGLIRADNRAYWYGAIFEDISPEAFCAFDNAKYHHFTYYNCVELEHRKAEGFKLAKVYDENRAAAERFRHAMGDRPVVCSDINELSEGVDLVFICNAFGTGADRFAPWPQHDFVQVTHPAAKTSEVMATVGIPQSRIGSQQRDH